MKKITILLMTLCINAYGGIFGPSNYEECILDNMKGVQSDMAARGVMQACRIKFPLPPSPEPAAQEYSKIYSFSGLDINSSGMTKFNNNIPVNKVQIDHDGQDYGYGVKSYDFKYYVSLHVTNRNNFPIRNISVGVIKSGNSCSWDSKNYSEFYDCYGSSSAMNSSVYKCYVPNAERTNRKYCVIGFSVNAYPSDIQQFIKLNELPQPK
jgi:hypothetical protein